jgi:hypothetical protein
MAHDRLCLLTIPEENSRTRSAWHALSLPRTRKRPALANVRALIPQAQQKTCSPIRGMELTGNLAYRSLTLCQRRIPTLLRSAQRGARAQLSVALSITEICKNSENPGRAAGRAKRKHRLDKQQALAVQCK